MPEPTPPHAATVLALPRSFASRYGVPVIRAVEAGIFTRRYFTHCLDCTFCHDWCCQFGVDVDLVHHRRILEHAAGIEALTGVPRDQWFDPDPDPDPEMPGGGSRRARVRDGACVFLDRRGRGCHIHAYAAARGIDYHDLKSIIDCLFPLTFGDGLLCVTEEVEDGDLVCLDQGPTLYRGLRQELRYYFGDHCIAALDAVEAAVLTSAVSARSTDPAAAAAPRPPAAA
jgi:hypothetical protein